MNANGDNMETNNWQDVHKSPGGNIEKPAQSDLEACSATKTKSGLPPKPGDDGACEQELLTLASVEDRHGESCDSALPFDAVQEHTSDASDDECEDVVLEGVVPIELGEDEGMSDEDACEFCSPRLEAGGHGWKRNVMTGCDHCVEGTLMLDQLDDDALYYIASFLEARTVRFSLTLVCHRFHVLFSREAYYWRTRYATQLGAKCRCPTIKPPASLHVADQCLAWDDSQRVWRDSDNETHHFMYDHNILGVVDAVHLMSKGHLVVSGDRNRNLNLIDLSRYPGPGASDQQMRDMLVHSNGNSHGGWVWTIDSVDNTILTGSWDTRVRLFDAGSECQMVSSYKCNSPVLSLYAEENTIFASCFDRKINFIDRRSSEIKSRVFHSKAVLCVTGNEKFIISGSEDKRVCIYDRRAAKVYKMFKLESFPLCLSFHDDQLWFGDRAGKLHLHDGTDSAFKHIGSYDVGHTQKMTGLINRPGAVFTCSGDGTIKVLEPTRSPVAIASLHPHKKEVADVAYSHGVLASAGDDCIGLWLPKHWDRNTYLL